jgi:hypothetical protein
MIFFNRVPVGRTNSVQETPMTEHDISLWKMLRRPFPLVPRLCQVHQCEWEKICIDVLGCTICSKIHRCSEGNCNLIYTSEARVCEISGMCVYMGNPTNEDFSDRISPYFFCTSQKPFRRTITREQVEACVHSILLSTQSRKAYKIEVQRRSNKMSQYMLQNIESRYKNQSHVNVIDTLESVQALFSHNKLLATFAYDLRFSVSSDIVDSIMRVLNTCQMQWPKNIKPMEVKIYIIGLMYLMRSGVTIHNIQVIPCKPIILYLLPSENLLDPLFQLKSKYITNIENKFKYFFRQISPNTLQEMGFHNYI